MAGITIPSYNPNQQTQLQIMKKDAIAFGSFKSQMIKIMNNAFPLTIINGNEVYGSFNFNSSVTDVNSGQGAWMEFINTTEQERQDIADAVDSFAIERIEHNWSYKRPDVIEENSLIRAYAFVRAKMETIGKVEIESYCKAYNTDTVLEADRIPESFENIFGQNLPVYYYEGDTFDITATTTPDSATCSIIEAGLKYRVSRVYDTSGAEITGLLTHGEKDWLLMMITTTSYIANSPVISKGTVHRTFVHETVTYEQTQSLTVYNMVIESDYMSNNWNSYTDGATLMLREKYHLYYDNLEDFWDWSDYGVIDTGASSQQIVWATMEAQRSALASKFFVRNPVDKTLYLKRKVMKQMKREELSLILGNYIEIKAIQKSGVLYDMLFFFIEAMQKLTEQLGKLVDFLYEFPMFRWQIDLLVWIISLFSDKSKEEILERVKNGLVEVIKFVFVILLGLASGGTGWVTGIAGATGSALTTLIIEMIIDVISLAYTLYDVGTKPLEEDEKKTDNEPDEPDVKAMVTKDAENFNEENDLMFNGKYNLLDNLKTAIEEPYNKGTKYNKELNKGGIE